MSVELPFAEACERNKDPIRDALRSRLPERGRVLEIGSGTGQHVVHFAPLARCLSWQPSERREQLDGLNARIRREGGANVLPAIELDVFGPWPDRVYEAAYSANTANILSWPGVCALFAGVGPRLQAGASFFLYGPFNVDGEFTAVGNEIFDRQLRERDPAMGLRDTGDLERLGSEHQMDLTERISLPANNQLLVFRRRCS